jgi:RND family efflux transporter MFP subunit
MPFRRRAALALVAALLAAPALARKNVGAAPEAPRPQPPVVAKPLSEVALFPEREASAQAVSLNESRIAAEISGRIEAIPVQVGERIARGAVLVRIDCRDHELARERALAALAAARSRLALAEHQLTRARELGAQGFYSKEAVEARATEAAVLRAETKQAEVQRDSALRAVSKCVVHAPFPAIVRERLGQIGELAAPGAPLVALADTARVEVSAQVQVGDSVSLAKAREVRFDGDGGERRVRLLRISPAIDRQARTVEARLGFAAAPAAPGAAGRILWRDHVPHLPSAYVVRRGGRLGVFVAQEGVARFRPLAEAQEGRPAPADLPLDTRIVVSGQLLLRDGEKLP